MNGEPKYVTIVSGESPCQVVDGLADGFMRWLGKERVRPYLLFNPSANASSSEFSYFRDVYDWMKTGHWEWEPEQSELLVLSMRSFDKVAQWVNDQKFHCAVATIDPRDKPPDETITLDKGMAVQVAFRREVTYAIQGPPVYPCPMGLVPESIVPLRPHIERSIPVSFMCSKTNNTRQAFADAVSTIADAKVIFDTRIDREEYQRLLADSKISVACYGGGFDTYRYWEIPYFGALLVAQSLPLLIPNNFRNGLHALFYTSPPELLGILSWARQHPLEVETIAEAGTLHLLNHHLTIHRAQYLTRIIQAKIQEFLATNTLTRFPY